MFDLKPYLDVRRQLVNQALQGYLDITESSASRLPRAMMYSLMAGGKRLRPILCLAAIDTVGGDREKALPLACALEMIHTYSLVHDDLPAMDDDRKRRGQPTCHIQFDEATAILTGDALLTLAFEILATAADSETAVSPRCWLQCIALVAAAAGFNGMIEGQMRDMAFEGRPISREELESLHALKTGRMIEVSVFSGAVLAGASQEQQRALQVYARHIGLAFQVADDILNVRGDPERLGKATGTDHLRGKNTYPALMGLSAAETFAAELVDRSLKALDAFDKKADPLRAIARYVIERQR